jgi:26S proteasome regulatory subunit T1
MSQKKEEQK